MSEIKRRGFGNPTNPETVRSFSQQSYERTNRGGAHVSEITESMRRMGRADRADRAEVSSFQDAEPEDPQKALMRKALREGANYDDTYKKYIGSIESNDAKHFKSFHESIKGIIDNSEDADYKKIRTAVNDMSVLADTVQFYVARQEYLTLFKDLKKLERGNPNNEDLRDYLNKSQREYEEYVIRINEVGGNYKQDRQPQYVEEHRSVAYRMGRLKERLELMLLTIKEA